MIKKRNPFLALLLGFMPGLGQLYNGQHKKAVIILLIDYIVIFFVFYTQLFMSVIGICILLFVSVSMIIYRLIDAFIVAKKSKLYELKKYNKWYVYVLFIAAIVISHLIIEETSTTSLRSFNITSSAMDPTIIVGDRVITQIGYYKNHDMDRNDLIVFHYPGEKNKQINEKTHYVSRCVAIPGDSISIIDKKIYINSKPSTLAYELKYKYKCFTNDALSVRTLEKYNIQASDIYLNDMIRMGSQAGYLIDMSNENIDRLRKSKLFDSIVDLNMEELDPSTLTFPFAHKSANWTTHNYGPLWIPKKGATIKLDSDMIEMYGQTILHYEGNLKAELVNGDLFINGYAVSEYTFKQNYYFTMGDNRDNSSDGRYWGFVPEDHLAGKAWLLLYSYDPVLSFPVNIRKERFFIPIK